MGSKHKCCKSYKKKGKACKGCPKTAGLRKRKRKRLLRKYRKR